MNIGPARGETLPGGPKVDTVWRFYLEARRFRPVLREMGLWILISGLALAGLGHSGDLAHYAQLSMALAVGLGAGLSRGRRLPLVLLPLLYVYQEKQTQIPSMSTLGLAESVVIGGLLAAGLHGGPYDEQKRPWQLGVATWIACVGALALASTLGHALIPHATGWISGGALGLLMGALLSQTLWLTAVGARKVPALPTPALLEARLSPELRAPCQRALELAERMPDGDPRRADARELAGWTWQRGLELQEIASELQALDAAPPPRGEAELRLAMEATRSPGERRALEDELAGLAHRRVHHATLLTQHREGLAALEATPGLLESPGSGRSPALEQGLELARCAADASARTAR